MRLGPAFDIGVLARFAASTPQVILVSD